MLKVTPGSCNPDDLEKTVAAYYRVVAMYPASGVIGNPIIKRIENVQPVLVVCDSATVVLITEELKEYFGVDRVESMASDTSVNILCLLAPKGEPYLCWNFGSKDHNRLHKAHSEGRLDRRQRIIRQDTYPPLIQPTLKAET